MFLYQIYVATNLKMKPFSILFSNLTTLIAGKGLRSDIARNGLGSLMLKATSILLSFVITVTLARMLGANGYGVYVYVFSLISFISIPAEFGLPNLVMRETAKYLAKHEWGKIQGVWHWSSKIAVILIIVLVFCFGMAAVIFKDRFSQEQLIVLFWGLAMAPLITLGNLRGAALRGVNWVVYGQLPEQAFRPIFYILFILGMAFVFPSENFTPAIAMSLQVLAVFLAFTIGAWFLWKATPLEVRQAKPIYEGHRWLSSTVPLAFISGAGLITSYTSVIILGFFVTSAEVGIYRVADQMALLVSISLQAINLVVSPQFARLYAIGDKDRLQHLVTASARVVLSLTLPVVIMFLLFGKPILRFVFGAEFMPAYEPLSILALGQLVNSVTGSVGFLLIMTGHELDTARGMVIAAVVNIMLNLILIPLWGTIGAALASAITLTLWNVLLWLAVRQRLDINSMAFNIWKI